MRLNIADEFSLPRLKPLVCMDVFNPFIRLLLPFKTVWFMIYFAAGSPAGDVASIVSGPSTL